MRVRARVRVRVRVRIKVRVRGRLGLLSAVHILRATAATHSVGLGGVLVKAGSVGVGQQRAQVMNTLLPTHGARMRSMTDQ